ncbi:MAG: bifunctional riboflavin kinase/FAD synthetase [Micrococcales bacterium]
MKINTPAKPAKRSMGAGRGLVAVYAIFAVAATARATYQIIAKFNDAPLAYSLSAVAAVVYLLITFALAQPAAGWAKFARIAIFFELAGVASVGTLSYTHPELFAHASVWSAFGQGYLYIPVVLPIWGLFWLAKKDQQRAVKMQSWTSIEQVPEDFGPTVVTIGKYDGIHLGHQEVLAELVRVAKASGLKSVVLTFDRHPDALLKPGWSKDPLLGRDQKLSLLQAQGIDAVLTLPFDNELADTPPEAFVQQTLVNTLKAKQIVVGEDFRFGHYALGNADFLKVLAPEYGFTVSAVDHVDASGSKISTTAIRELLDSGNVAAAASLLGRPHETIGVIEHGLKLGRTIGFPTANFSRESEGYLPMDGVYSGWLLVDGQRYPAALSIGINDTIQAVPRLLEAYVLDRTDLDFYGKIVTAQYVDFVRPSAKFAGLDELVAAIKRDVEVVRGQLGIPR